jgi:hypothetical protein
VTAQHPNEGLACPSAPADEGATLLGIVGPSGEIGYVSPLIQIDETFLNAAAGGRPLEERFRFSQPCVEAKCGFWNGSGCNVIEHVLEQESPAPASSALRIPRCSIRPNCRWFHQRGLAACRACRFVVTKVSQDGRQYQEAVLPAASAATAGD